MYTGLINVALDSFGRASKEANEAYPTQSQEDKLARGAIISQASQSLLAQTRAVPFAHVIYDKDTAPKAKP